MGKAELRVIRVPKWGTAILLIATSAAMAALLYLLSGRAYAADTHPFLDLASGILGNSARGPVSRNEVLAFLMPVLANALLFVPFGCFAFLLLDRPLRGRGRTYGMVVLAAAAFAAAMFVWQSYLPTRVTSALDILANAGGAFAGAAIGHIRKTVRVRFEPERGG